MAENFFKKRRDKLKLTQRQIAEAFDPQITPASVSAWEKNVAAPSMDMVDEVARVYRVSADEIVEAIREVWAARKKKRLALAAK